MVPLEPPFPMPVPLLDVNAQNLPLEEELTAVFTRVLRSGRFILGPEVEAFEEECAAAVGADHAISLSSGTDALLVSLMALGIGPGDEVLCPAFTFFATAGCISRVGATPVFCDVRADSFNLDLDSVRERVTERTRAVVPVHLYGQAVEMGPLLDFAKERGLAVVEDVAQAIGATWRGRGCGTMGETGCFSFFPSKNLGGFGDGGLVTTQDSELAERLRRLRNHGMHPKYHHSGVGGNFRMDALQCALLRVKLRHLSGYAAARASNAADYRGRISRLPGAERILLPAAAEGHGHVWNQFTLRALEGRDDLAAHLAAAGVGCEVYYPVPLHHQQCFAHLPAHALRPCPVAERLCGEVISLPVYPELSAGQREEVVAAIGAWLAG